MSSVSRRDLELMASRIASGTGRRMHTAGKIEFIRDQGPVRRDVRAPGFKWSPDSFRDLAKILWAAQRAHSYGMAAYRLFSRMSSSDFSPDGLLGGRGYIQSVKDLRAGVAQAVESLSTFTDTINDEINAPHWATVNAPASEDLIANAEDVRESPEKFVQGEMQDEIQNPDAESMNPVVESDEGDPEEESEEEGPAAARTSSGPPRKPGSKLPEDKSEQKQGKTEPEMEMHTVSPDHGSYAASVRAILKSHESRFASSSLPYDTAPSPIVDHIGPAAGNEAGHFNDDEVWPSDDPMGEGFHSLRPLYEDGNDDGVTGLDDPTIGDETVLKVSSSKISYSWLPGADNRKVMNLYDPQATEADRAWMIQNSEPDYPGSPVRVRATPDPLWGRRS